MKVCVLQPDYSNTSIDYANYDPPRNVSHLLPGHEVEHVFLNKLTTYQQLKHLAKKNFDIYVNLCEGYLEWDIPSIEVIYFLELLNLPFTGPTSILYDPPKDLMKYVAYTQNVQTPAYTVIENVSDISASTSRLSYPLFIKPLKAGDSLGIDERSMVANEAEAIDKAASIINEYSPLLIEEYVMGREFTVMVAADPRGHGEVITFEPVEYLFPKGKTYKTYALKTSELHPESNVKINDPDLVGRLKQASKNIFNGFDGVGYARLDFRMNGANELFFLDINFTCSVFYKDGYEGSADYILKIDGSGQARFLQTIITEGINRHKRTQKKYKIKGDAIAGFGIYATMDLSPGEILFAGEEKAQRIATKNHIEANWRSEEKDTFRKYAYPLSKEIYVLWDKNPSEWAPQNHSCDPNTGYKGLNVLTLRAIKKDEELTLDYASFLDNHMEPFECRCGQPGCQGLIKGIMNNSVTVREALT